MKINFWKLKQNSFCFYNLTKKKKIHFFNRDENHYKINVKEDNFLKQMFIKV